MTTGTATTKLRETTVFLSLLPPSQFERRLAVGLVFILATVFFAILPFVKDPLTPAQAFIPAYQAVLLFSDLATAALLFGQFSIQRTRGLLVLATAYFFTGLATVPHTLSFPGLFAPTGIIGAGPQTTVWLYMIWHAGFPLLTVVYAVLKDDERPLVQASRAGWLAAAGAVLVVVASTLLTTQGHALLPILLRPDLTYTPLMLFVVSSVWGLNFVSLAALLSRRPYRTIDLWMIVVTVAWIGDVGLSAALNAKRFDVGFYSGRAYGLVAAMFVLGMLLLETRGLYARVAGRLVSARDQAERRARRVLETSLDLILVTDGYGKLLEVNDAARRILGFEPHEMIGRSGSDFIFAEDLEPTRREMRAARAGGGVIRNFRCRYVNRAGQPVSLVWTGIWSEADHLHFFIGRDMTDIEAKEDQLRQSQKMEAVGQLTGGVAHDFNNILMVILANVEELQESDNLTDDQREMLASVATSGARAAEMTKRLLAFSRKQRLRPQPTDLSDLVTGIDKLLRRTLGEQIEIEPILAKELWVTSVDRSQVEAALVNLCVNARDAMPKGGRLILETANAELDQDYAAANTGAVPGQYVMLAVSDTGTGIPPELLIKVFEPFFTTKEVGKGTGLGLSMVYGFIKQSNGHIKIYSEVGRGTTIRMYLPRSSSAIDRDDQALQPMPVGRERVLLVEDDDQVRGTVLRQLRGLGYVVTEASGGEMALDRLEAEERFDLMLSDTVMPGLDGPGLVRIARERWPAMKVLLMSGYSEHAARNRVESDIRILSKPFRRVDLATRVRETLDA